MASAFQVSAILLSGSDGSTFVRYVIGLDETNVDRDLVANAECSVSDSDLDNITDGLEPLVLSHSIPNLDRVGMDREDFVDHDRFRSCHAASSSESAAWFGLSPFGATGPNGEALSVSPELILDSRRSRSHFCSGTPSYL